MYYRGRKLRVMLFNANFTTIFLLYRGSQFDWSGKPESPEKTTDLPEVTDKFYHIILYQVHFAMSRI